MARILVVDDSSYARGRLRQTLEAHEHTVFEASSGMQALEGFVVNPPDLVMLDLTMADLGGMEVLERLREIDPDVKVIVVSADIQRSTGRMATEKGAKRFLGKPADPEELIDAVNSVLGNTTS
jgi:two-component system chemotaxis response regulator CheY